MQYWKTRIKNIFPNMNLEDIENLMQMWMELYDQPGN